MLRALAPRKGASSRSASWAARPPYPSIARDARALRLRGLRASAARSAVDAIMVQGPALSGSRGGQPLVGPGATPHWVAGAARAIIGMRKLDGVEVAAIRDARLPPRTSLLRGTSTSQSRGLLLHRVLLPETSSLVLNAEERNEIRPQDPPRLAEVIKPYLIGRDVE